MKPNVKATESERERKAIRRRIAELVAEVEAEGWTVEWVKYVESTESPGWLGMAAGICIESKKKIKVATHKATLKQRLSVLEHEIEHMRGAEWAFDHEILGLRCGGRRNAFGEPISAPRGSLHHGQHLDEHDQHDAPKGEPQDGADPQAQHEPPREPSVLRQVPDVPSGKSPEGEDGEADE